MARRLAVDPVNPATAATVSSRGSPFSEECRCGGVEVLGHPAPQHAVHRPRAASERRDQPVSAGLVEVVSVGDRP
jgi:hypothetical protein